MTVLSSEHERWLMDFASEMLKKSAGGVHGLYAENMRRAVRLGREVLAEIENPTEPKKETPNRSQYMELVLPVDTLVGIDGMPFRLTEEMVVYAIDPKVEAEPRPKAAQWKSGADPDQPQF